MGYVPQHLSEHVDRGDQNISLISVGFFGTLVSSDIVQSALVSSTHPGHGHGGADGENQHWIKDINGNIAKGRPGMRLNTLPDFFNQVPRTYNKATNNRLLGSPLLACTLDWDSYLDGAFNEIGGITPGLGRNNAQKNAEPFAF